MELKRLQESDAERARLAIGRLKIADPDLRRALTDRHLRRFLQKPENVLIVATDAGGPIGFALAYLLDRADRDRRMMLFYEIEVEVGHRRQGVARAMVDLLKSLCAQQNVFKMWVHTNRSNRAAVALYERTGGTAHSSADEISFRYDFGPQEPPLEP